MKFNTVLNNFTAGQWSTKMLANTESEEYKKACKTLQNMLVLKEGGAYQRPGFRYANVGAEQATLNSVGYDIRTFPIIGRSLGIRKSYVLVTTPNVPSTDWFIYDPETGGVITTFNVDLDVDVATDMEDASYVQVGEFLFIANKEGKMPMYVHVEDDACWIYGIRQTNQSNPFYRIPFRNPNVLGEGDPADITSSANAGAVTLTASSVFFVPTMVGAMIKLTAAGQTGVAYITAVGGAGTPQLTCTALIIRALCPVVACGTAAGTSWEITAWNDYYGWPTKVTAFEQRIFWGGKSDTIISSVTKDHNMIWASRSGDIFDMMEVPLAQDPYFTEYDSDNSRPFSFAPAYSTGSVKALTSAKVLIVGYSNKEMTVRGVQGALGPLDISIDSNSSHGMNDPQPVVLDNNAVYVQAGGQALRQLMYSDRNEQYNSFDIGFVSDIAINREYYIHKIVATKINDTPFLFALVKKLSVNTLSELWCASIDQQNNINAWGRINLNNTIIVDICAPNTINNLKFGLTIVANGPFGLSYATMLLKLENIFDSPTYAYNNMFYYMDYFIELDPGGSAVITATPYGNGDSVHVFCDGDYKGIFTVAAGVFTVDATTYRKVVFGLAYTAKLFPAPIKTLTQAGNSHGKLSKVDSVYVKFYNTLNVKYGNPERNDFYPVVFRKSTVIAENLTPLFTGELRFQFPPGQSREKQIGFINESPSPMNILSVAVEGFNYD